VTDTGRLGRARPHPANKDSGARRSLCRNDAGRRVGLVATLGAIKNNLAIVEEAISASTEDAREDASAAE
jgi:hypothetical protein